MTGDYGKNDIQLGHLHACDYSLYTAIRACLEGYGLSTICDFLLCISDVAVPSTSVHEWWSTVTLYTDQTGGEAMARKSASHIVVFPWLAFGHMPPFLELFRALAMRGHLISCLSTCRNIQRLPKIPPHQSSLITLLELTLPPTEGTSEDAESTMDLEVQKVPTSRWLLTA
ncbi:hypothetical protein Taro_007287 [Colocasia esculenta]|uniref:Uncharacterized protein n=1 Tax=Colocasia esculenta TaxID=4460 RepID=A0A843TZZ3_COLES|nr:hypothetical protein [Colocasia esculenta]